MPAQLIKRVPPEMNALTGPDVEVTLLIAGNGLPERTVNAGPFCGTEFQVGLSRMVISVISKEPSLKSTFKKVTSSIEITVSKPVPTTNGFGITVEAP